MAEIEGEAGAFTLRAADGDVVTARRVLLATGVADTLPDIPGLDALWGDCVAHCPYCHGFEFSGTPVGILGADASVPLRAAMLDRIASHLVVLTNGAELDEDVAGALKRMEVEVRTEPVVGAARGPLGIDVELDGRTGRARRPVRAPRLGAGSPVAEQLDLDRSPMGAILVDAFGHASRPGIYAAGDIAQTPGTPMPMASVLAAAAAGQLAAAACDRELAAADNGLSLPVCITGGRPRCGRKLPLLLWLVQMGMVLFWVYDGSLGRTRTRQLVRQAVPILDKLLRATRIPGVRGIADDVVVLVKSLVPPTG